MAILATQDFDALSDLQVINTAALGNAAWDVFTTSTIPEARAAAALHGARGALIPAADGPVIFNWNAAASSSDTRVTSCYFRLLVAPSALTYIMLLRDGSTVRADWRINADRTVTLRNANVATGGASPEVLAMDTWYRAEWMTSTSGQELRIYAGESATPYITRSGALTNKTHTRTSCGIVATPNGHSLHLDTLRVGDDWVGPYEASPPEYDPMIAAYRYTEGGTWIPLGGPASLDT